MADQNPAPRKLWAIVVIGTKMPNGLPAYLSKDGNTFYPVAVYTHADKAKVERRLKSLESMNRNIRFFDSPGMTLNSPFFGVVEIVLPPKKAGRKPSAEQIAKMQAGREFAFGQQASAPKETPTAASGDKAKTGRK